MCVSDKNHHSNFLRSSAKRQSFPEVDMIKESERKERNNGQRERKGRMESGTRARRKREKASLWVAMNFPAREFPPPPHPPRSTLHIIM